MHDEVHYGLRDLKFKQSKRNLLPSLITSHHMFFVINQKSLYFSKDTEWVARDQCFFDWRNFGKFNKNRILTYTKDFYGKHDPNLNKFVFLQISKFLLPISSSR